jgi:Raf kinase inhibitor-like YbhB/YbcL family protein
MFPLRSTLLLGSVVLACASTAHRPDAGALPPVEPDAALAREAGAEHDVAVASSPRDASLDLAIVADAVAGNDALDASGERAADVATDAGAELRLTSDGFLIRNGELIFPASASFPLDQSPPFSWSGAPAATRSFALTFVDRSNGATKWVLWDIPAGTTTIPANLSKSVHPSELPASSQRGSLGRTGYSGPGVPGPPLHVYEFVLWALDVDQLPGTAGLSTVELRTRLLPAHSVISSAALVAKGQEGGP